MSPIINNVGNFITRMTRPDAIEPVIALEAAVTGGRTNQAYKRGGADEARERLIEESTGAVVWLAGVKVLNDYVGDPILKKMFGANFDVGTDNVLRTPFKNFIKKNPSSKFSARQIAGIKAIKVLASVLIADAFIGLVVPPLNQRLTRNLANKKAKEEQAINSQDKLELSNKNNPTFKGGGGFGALNAFTNAIENTNTGKLLSTDAGLISGRMYSARNNDERREIAIRDIGSIYFYMWAQGHVGNVMNFAESGRFTRLNPTTANTLNEHLNKFLESKGGELSVEEFRKAVLGKNSADIKLPEITFESEELSKITKFFDKFRSKPTEALQAVRVSELENLFTAEEFARIKEMSKLQPLRQGEAVVTKQQIIDALNVCEINNPELLDKTFVEFTKGASKDELKFVSNKKLYGLKADMENYVKDICKEAKNGKINKDLLKKVKNKNLMFSGINFAAGFAVAALFLSTLIPKFQYWVTRMKTGKDEFPGTYDLKK
ncbi:hypothetical protein IJ384_07275 [bacterium]|nr:hypothetical protein [bacterium]